MGHVTVGKWGNNLAVRLPADVAASTQLRDGDRVEIEAQDANILIRRVEAPLSLEEMFRGKTAAAWRAEYAQAYDWGADIGREVVPE
jgi:antitoxin component of MazEF toxin-antitoxin module